MDPQRFDRWSKAVAGNLTRRETVGGIGLAGLLAAFVPWRGVRTVVAQEGATTCTYDFEAAIAVGRGAQNQTRLIAGELRLTIEPDGAIDDGVLIDEDGQEAKVVGQATGRAINLRIALGDDDVLVAVGTAENGVRDCRGLISGVANGPQRGDLGDWVATVPSENDGSDDQGSSDGQSSSGQGQSSGDQGSSSGGNGGGSSQCSIECLGDEIEYDEANCSCICPPGLITCVAEIGSIPAKGGVIFNAQPVAVPTGYCVDPLSDVSNCGACGNFCTGDVGAEIASCNEGVCNYTCKPGYGQCGGDPADPCTTDLMSDSNNCGTCGYVCPGNLSCNNGLCTCLLACIDPQTLDFNNCQCVCPGGLAACGGGCVDTNTDPNNCGGCGNVCRPFEPVCDAGNCHAIASQ